MTQPDSKPLKNRLSIKNPFVLLILSIFFFFILDTLIFRSGAYLQFMKPNDVGTLYIHVQAAKNFERDKDKSILSLGNSQFERGFSGSQFKREHDKLGIHIVALDAPKTYEQIWYYALKYSDPHHNKFDAILITLPDFKVEPFVDFGQPPNYSTATFLAPFIGVEDWLDLIKSYKQTDLRLQVTKLAVLSGHAYAFDLQDFLMRPARRLVERRYITEQGPAWNIDPPDVPGSWSDVKIDGLHAECPASYAYFDCVNGVQVPIQPIPLEAAKARTAANEKYERTWLGNIFDLYKNSPTKIFIVQMPRWPVPVPDRLPLPDAPDLRTMFANRPDVTFIDDSIFAELESPKNMRDHVHVSTAAQNRFTEILSAEIDKMVHKD